MYVSPCAAHYYRQRFERMNAAELAEQRRLLQDGLQAIEEERAEVAGMAGREAAKLRGNLERDAVELRAMQHQCNDVAQQRRQQQGDRKVDDQRMDAFHGTPANPLTRS